MKFSTYIPIVLILICAISISTIHHLSKSNNLYSSATINYQQLSPKDPWQINYTWKSVNTTIHSHTTSTTPSYTTSDMYSSLHSTTHIPSLHMTNNAHFNSIGGGIYHTPIHNKWTNRPSHSEEHLSYSSQNVSSESSANSLQSPILPILATNTSSAQRVQMYRSSSQSTTSTILATSVPQMATTTYDDNYSINGIRNKMNSDSPFEPGTLPSNPNEPENMPIGDCPIGFIAILCAIYLVFFKPTHKTA